MAILLKANGYSKIVEPRRGKTFTLEELQGYVGGYIELLRVGRAQVYFDEEGKLKDKPRNEAATILLGEKIGRGDFIVGDALVCSDEEIRKDDDGEE